MKKHWAQALMVLGFIAFVAGVIDPLEGSVVIMSGSILVLAAMFLGHAERPTKIYWLWVTVAMAVGVGALWGFSAVGGFGGRTGRSMGWGLTLLPYPLAWVAGMRWLVSELVRIRRKRRLATT